MFGSIPHGPAVAKTLAVALSRLNPIVAQTKIFQQSGAITGPGKGWSL